MEPSPPSRSRRACDGDPKTYGDIGKLPLLLLSGFILLLALKFAWPLRWILSGTAILSICLVLGDFHHARVLAFMPLWTQLALLNFAYGACATSWLFWWIFALICYPTILIVSLFQFDFAAHFVRKRLRRVLRQLHFINDKIALFNIPALEIDTDVEGLFVIRGITLSLSHLSIVAHGVEVGIKLTEDVELSIQVDEVTVRLFRSIMVGDVYANVKGGEFEMTFGKLARRSTGDTLMVSDTPLLEAAAARGNTTRPDLARVRSRVTSGGYPKDVSAKTGLDSLTQISPDESSKKYRSALDFIHKTSAIQESVQEILKAESSQLNADDEKSLRAAICSQLHDRPSVPHPPLQSVKVSTLKNLSNPRTREFMHRLPLLLRLLLNPLSYFHPITIASITAAGSGKWLQHTLHENIFKHYGESDTGIRKLERRVSSWLSDANFVLQLVDIKALANVPLSTNNDITSQLKINDVLAYRTLPKEVDLREVVRLGGADANVTIPSFLLPHHEHVLPPEPTEEDERRQEEEVKQADGLPKEVQATKELERTLKDETTVPFSAHAQLPAVFDQELLDFIAALVKAVKIIEMEKDPEVQEVAEALSDADSIHSIESATSPTKRSLRDVALQLNTNMKRSMKVVNDGMRRVGIDAVANDRFIAKLVGKITKKLETAQGDLGYSGEIPVPLQPYRDAAETATKLLP